MLPSGSVEFRFGPFHMRPDHRELLANGEAVSLNARTFDLLAFLLENRERVLSREEILTGVWSGVTVSDSNLNVQMSALRRVLSAHAGSMNLIASLPGRGYKFVGDVVEEIAADEAARPVVETTSAPWWAVLPRRRVGAAAAGLAGISLAAIVVGWSILGSSLPGAQPYFSVLLEPVHVSGSGPARSLAIVYQDAIQARLGLYGDTRVFTPRGDGSAPDSVRYVLAGTITGAETGTAALSYELSERKSGTVVSADVLDVPARPDRASVLNGAVELVHALRPALFVAEREKRPGPPKSAFDYFLAAQAETQGELSPEHIDHAIALLEKGFLLDRSSTPIRITLASLLRQRLLVSSARAGDRDGERALELIEPVLQSQPDNYLVLSLKAAILLALGRSDAAEACTRLGLRIEPGDEFLTRILIQTLLEGGKLNEAVEVLSTADFHLEDAIAAQLAFAQRRYDAAETFDERMLAAEPVARDRGLMQLLQTATLVRLGRDKEAGAVLAAASKALPLAFSDIGSLRPSYFELSPPSWRDMTDALTKAGMSRGEAQLSEVTYARAYH